MQRESSFSNPSGESVKSDMQLIFSNRWLTFFDASNIWYRISFTNSLSYILRIPLNSFSQIRIHLIPFSNNIDRFIESFFQLFLDMNQSIQIWLLHFYHNINITFISCRIS